MPVTKHIELPCASCDGSCDYFLYLDLDSAKHSLRGEVILSKWRHRMSPALPDTMTDVTTLIDIRCPKLCAADVHDCLTLNGPNGVTAALIFTWFSPSQLLGITGTCGKCEQADVPASLQDEPFYLPDLRSTAHSWYGGASNRLAALVRPVFDKAMCMRPTPGPKLTSHVYIPIIRFGVTDMPWRYSRYHILSSELEFHNLMPRHEHSRFALEVHAVPLCELVSQRTTKRSYLTIKYLISENIMSAVRDMKRDRASTLRSIGQFVDNEMLPALSTISL